MLEVSKMFIYINFWFKGRVDGNQIKREISK